jgi:hypothetical protein
MTKMAGSGSFSLRHGSGSGSTSKCHGSGTLLSNPDGCVLAACLSVVPELHDRPVLRLWLLVITLPVVQNCIIKTSVVGPDPHPWIRI